MEPKNHLFEKENHLSKPLFSGSKLIFQGVIIQNPIESGVIRQPTKRFLYGCYQK